MSIADIIEKYKETGDKALRNEVVLSCESLIKYAALSTRNMYQKYAQTEDIINEATLSLMGAIETFDPDRNVKFETYASMKMRGGIIDYIRRQDIIPRSVRKFSKDLSAAFSDLYGTLGHEPSSIEIAEYMGLSIEKLSKNMSDTAGIVTMSFEELLYEGDFDIESSSPQGVWEVESDIYKKERDEILAKAIESLKEKQRTVISLYYYERLKFSDIAKVLGVSESRICQIHSKAMLNLKYSIENYIKG